MSFEFGKFGFCKTASYRVCSLFGDVPRDCSVEKLDQSFPKSANIANFVSSIILAFLAAFLMWRSRRKFAAVGRKEMYTFYGFLFLATVLELVASGGFLGRTDGASIIASIQIGLSVATFWALMVNGFISFQWVDDGTVISMLLLAGTSVLVAIITTYFGIDAALGLSDSLKPTSTANPQYLPVWILYFLVPLVCVIVYLASQLFIVLRYLATRRPLISLLLATIAIIVAQLFQTVVSNPICVGTDGAVDGSFFATILTGVSAIFLFRYWDSITEDELDEFNY